ncbi:MAG: hypothetical protein ACUVXJ_18490 [Phycisphaerae bacterium]
MKRFAITLVTVCALVMVASAAKPLLASPQAPAAGMSCVDNCGADRHEAKCGDDCKCGDQCKCGDDCKCGDECKCGDNCKCKCKDKSEDKSTCKDKFRGKS